MIRSPYSQLFTSGLLSESSSASPSRASSPFAELGPRRGSLPTDTPPPRLSGASQKVQSPTDESSAFYFTLQPRRDALELRSFLSLDLAESQSLRSASLRRKASNTSKFTARSVRSRLELIPSRKSSCIVDTRRHILPAHTAPANLRRSSRESLRSIPSPKPAPSTDLPEVPISHSIHDRPPRLPSIPPSPSLDIFIPHQSSRSSAMPSIVVKTPSLRSMSISSTYRHASRSHALAALEGRSQSALKRFQRNFMSMSDDEDEELDAPMRIDEEEEDVVIPPSPSKSAPLPSRYSSRSRSRRCTADSWFPLASFIDFRDEEISTWNWRSFIEVAVS